MMSLYVATAIDWEHSQVSIKGENSRSLLFNWYMSVQIYISRRNPGSKLRSSDLIQLQYKDI